MEFRSLSLTEQETLTTSPKILIVDDSESDRFSLVRYLQSDQENSYHIIEAETLKEGLEIWRSQQPDVVLLDINLPDGDGLEFLEAIGTDQPINKLPVIMLTGQGDERIAVRAMKLGAADYLVKDDVTAFSLLTAISQVQENDLLLRQLRRSQQQQTIIASIALHIRRSLRFEDVSNTIVKEISRFLEADRTLIYRFNPDMSGVIVAEAVVPPWQPCLNTQVEDTCFEENMGGEYQHGKIFAAADIYTANLTECHIELLERFQVRANLVVPILLNGHNTLWGLLIAHQCSGPRQWEEEDIQLLHQLSVHLAIALQQAELYQNLQTVNSSLEEKVEERTKKLELQTKVLEEIHDAVVTTDLKGAILNWNAGAENLYCYTEAEVLGNNISFMYEDAEALQAEVIVPLLANGKHTAEVITFSKSGQRICVNLRLSVVKDEQGNITHLIGCANDITDRKKAEQELQQLNQELETKVLERTQELQNVSERLSLSLKSGAFGCWEWNLVQNTKIWDKRMYELYELPQQADGSIPYEDWANRLHPEDRTSVETLLQQAILGEAEYKTEFRVIHPDESIHFIKAYGMLVRDEQAHPQKMIGINLDISDRKRTEAALIESEAKFRRLVEGANDVIWSTDTQGVFNYLSPQFQTIFGFDPNNWIGKTAIDLVHPDDLDWVISEQMRSIQSQQKVNYLEFLHRYQDGHYGWVSANSTPIINDEGITIGLQGLLTDISDRKQIEAELRESEAKFRRLVEGANDLIWSTDANWCFNYLSPQFQILFGFDSNDWIGKSVYNLVHPEDRDLMANEYVRSIQSTQKFTRTEFRHLHQDGHYLWVSINTTLIMNTEGIVIGAQGLVTDISERKKAEQEILENHRLIQQIADSSPNVLYLYDIQEQRNTYANREILTTLGYSAIEVQTMGAAWLPSVMHPDDLPPTLEHFERLKLADDHEVFTHEYRLRHANGQWRYFFSRDLVFSRDGQGQVKLIIGTAQDITDRKIAEAALRASDQRWQFALESAGDGIWDWNIQEHQVFFSRQWKAMLGYVDNEIENRFESWENLVHPDDLPQCYEDINKCLTDETPLYENEHRLRCKDGSYKWILARGKVFERTEDGHALRMMGTHTDLSDRKRAALELQQLTERLTLALKSGAIGCWDWNVADNSVYWDARMYEIYGISQETGVMMMYETWMNTIHPEDTHIIEGIIQQATSGVSDFEAEFRIVRPDGAICFIKDYGLVIRDSLGNIQGMIGINFDISDRKLAEAQLQQKNIELEELVQLREEALTLREDMSNMIVHDLRNPLSAILLSAEIIQKYGDRPDKKTILLKKAEQILTAGQRLKNMIDSLLLMAKLESGKILFNPVPTDLQELGNAILTDFELTANTQTIELKGELPNPGNSIVIDAVILRRVIENLISNALKFSPPNSQVWLKIEYLPENHLRVQVSDNGPGVSPDQAEDIFKKFEIGTVKANVSQIGLGLAFCKMAVEAQGGTLAIAPNQPQGSIFTVEI